MHKSRNKTNSHHPKEFSTTQEAEIEIPSFQERALEYVKNSSLCIFHRNSKLRKFMIELTTQAVRPKNISSTSQLLAQIQTLEGIDSDEEDEDYNHDHNSPSHTSPMKGTNLNHEAQLSPQTFVYTNYKTETKKEET